MRPCSSVTRSSSSSSSPAPAWRERSRSRSGVCRESPSGAARLGEHRALVGFVDSSSSSSSSIRSSSGSSSSRSGHGLDGLGADSGALMARKVATSMISRPKNTCASRKRRPMSRQLRNGALDLFRQRAGGDVEVLGRDADQQVAHAAADQEGLVARLAQPVQHAQRVGRDRGARYGMFGAGNDACGRPAGAGSRIVGTSFKSSESSAWHEKSGAYTTALDSGPAAIDAPFV